MIEQEKMKLAYKPELRLIKPLAVQPPQRRLTEAEKDDLIVQELMMRRLWRAVSKDAPAAMIKAALNPEAETTAIAEPEVEVRLAQAA